MSQKNSIAFGIENPDAAVWNIDKGAMAILMYDDARKADSPREIILNFLESAYQAGAKRASWDLEQFKLNHSNND